MAKSLADQLMANRATLFAKAQHIAQAGVLENRALTAAENATFDGLMVKAGRLLERAKAAHESEQNAHDIDASFRSAGDRQEGAFGVWARSARLGDGYTVSLPNGRQLDQILKGESRDMAAAGGVGPNSVSTQLWEYALHVGQILQSGVEVFATTHGNNLPFPVASDHAETSDTPVAANAALTLDEATIGTVNSTTEKYGFISYVPTELVQDATFDLEGYIARSAGRELGRRVSKVAAAGVVASFTTAGVTAPAGVLTDLGNQTTVGQGTDLIYKLFHSVLPEYRTNAAWIMADPTAAIVRSLKGSNGQSVWQPALTAGDPDLLVGKPVFIVPQIASPAANAKSMFFGDLSALKVRIAGGLRFERSDEFKFGNDQISFRGVVRCGAVGIDPNAVKHLLHPAS